MNREMRRAAARYKPSRSRPEQLPIPPMFGFTPETSRRLAMRDRQAIDAVITGTGTLDDILAVECIAVVQIYMLRDAIARPARHQAEPDGLATVLQTLERDVAPAVYGVISRYRETRRVGCSGIERQALLMLAEISDQTLSALPRRLHSEAYAYAVKNPQVRIEVPA